jgi:hypothetical protein
LLPATHPRFSSMKMTELKRASTPLDCAFQSIDGSLCSLAEAAKSSIVSIRMNLLNDIFY